jgi:hypothetical protein
MTQSANNTESTRSSSEDDLIAKAKPKAQKKVDFKKKAQLLFFSGIIVVVFILFPFTIETYRSVLDY